MTKFAKCPECRETSRIPISDLSRPDMYVHITCAFCHRTFTIDEWKKDSLLTAYEHRVLDNLAQAWNEFLKLDSLHPDEQTDFRKSIHEAQRNIMARPVRREFKNETH